MKIYQVGGREVLLNFHTPDNQLPPQYEGPLFHDLQTCHFTDNRIYLVYGDIHSFGLGVTFARGRKDNFAVIMIIYHEGQGYAYYPNDVDWLAVLHALRCLDENLNMQVLLDIVVQVMQLAVGKKGVTDTDIQQIVSFIDAYSHVISKVTYDTLIWWMIWFYYACVAEENYISSSGQPTKLGGLVKVVALIESGYEGLSLRDACDHYKAEYYRSVYQEQGSIVDAVIQKCCSYGIERKKITVTRVE